MIQPSSLPSNSKKEVADCATPTSKFDQQVQEVRETISALANKEGVIAKLSKGIEIKVMESRDESTVGARLKIIFNPFEKIERRYYVGNESDVEYDGPGAMYFNVNAEGKINLNEPHYSPMEANWLRSAGGAIRLLKDSRLIRNAIQFVRNERVFKNGLVRQQLQSYFRATASLGNGGSAAALEFEAMTGQMLSQGGHIQKVAQMRAFIFQALRGNFGALSSVERRFLIKELFNINRALRSAFGPNSQYPLNNAAKEAINILSKQPDFF